MINNTNKEFQFFSKDPLVEGFAKKDHLLTGEFSEYNQITTEFYNERPYCELISSQIFEYDEYLDFIPLSNITFPLRKERLFKKI